MQVARLTGAAGLSAASLFTANRPCKLEDFQIHLSAAGASENLTLTIDKYAGAAYDILVLTVAMNITDYVIPKTSLPIQLETGDVLKITWANTSTRTYGISAFFSKVV